jgi:hypothetical protein
MRRRLVLSGLLAAVCAAGCKPERRETYPEWTASRTERLLLFARVEKLAVAPVRDPGARPGLDPVVFARLLADELAALKRFKVIYPEQVVEAAETTNREAEVRARAGRRALTGDEIVDLERSEADAVNAARQAGAQAVLVASVHDFEVYPPKRLAVTFRVYLCAAAERGFADVIRMTDAGVPLEVPGTLRESFVWEQQRRYDAGRKGDRTDMAWHARKHERSRGFGDEVFYYSTGKFLSYVSAETADDLFRDAQWYRGQSGRRAAAARGLVLPLDGPGTSGFGLGSGERGVERNGPVRGGEAPAPDLERGQSGIERP